MSRRRPLVVAAIVVVAVVVAVVTTCAREPDATDSATSNPAASEYPRADVVPRKPRNVEQAESAADAALSDAEALKAPTIDGFPAVDVEVVGPDGPVAGADVYALLAGAAGRRDRDTGPHAETDADGRCLLPLPRSGVYDVGAVWNVSHRLACDIAVPRAAKVRIELPPTRTVTVVATQQAYLSAKRDFADRPYALLEPESGGGRKWPGRGEDLAWSRDVRFVGDMTVSFADLPGDVAIRARTIPEFSATPPTFKAPAVVRVDVGARYVIRVEGTIEPAEPSPSSDGWLTIEFDSTTGGGAAQRMREVRRIERGRALSEAQRRFGVTLLVSSPDGEIRWSGKGVVPGASRYAVREGLAEASSRGAPSRIEVAVHLDGSPLPTQAPEEIRDSRVARFRIAERAGSKERVTLRVASPDGGGGTDCASGEVAECRIVDPAWAVAFRGSDVAGPVPVARDRDAVQDLTLAPGGFLTVSVEAPPPAALGVPFALANADGSPLVSQREFAFRVEIENGARIGPLPPGEYRLLVLAGETTLGEVAARVEEGKTTPLSIPRLRPR